MFIRERNAASLNNCTGHQGQFLVEGWKCFDKSQRFPHHLSYVIVIAMKDFRKPTIKVSTNNIECGWGKLSKGWKPARVGPGNYTPITSRSRVTFLQKTTVCAYKRVSLHNTCWLKYSTRWRQGCFQCRCCLAYEGLASAGDEGAIVGSCIDEGKNWKCVFQNIKFAEDSSSEMVRQQSFKSVFYFELWVDRLVLSVWHTCKIQFPSGKVQNIKAVQVSYGKCVPRDFLSGWEMWKCEWFNFYVHHFPSSRSGYFYSLPFKTTLRKCNISAHNLNLYQSNNCCNC